MERRSLAVAQLEENGEGQPKESAGKTEEIFLILFKRQSPRSV
jgi:hypothetical protein